MSALRDWARLDARWYEDPVLRAAATEAPGSFVMWPVLVGMAKARSHALDNPDGRITISLEDLANACRLTKHRAGAAMSALVDADLIAVTAEKINVICITLNGFAKWQTPRKSRADRKAHADFEKCREKGPLGGGQVAVGWRSGSGQVTPDRRQETGDVDKEEEPLSAKADEVANVFEYWCKVERETGGLGSSGKGRTPKLTNDRAAKIRARLAEGYTPADLKMAIAFYARDPHHSGDNDRATRFTDLTTTLKNGSKVEAGVAGYEARGAGAAVTSNGVNVNAFVRSLGGAA
jgi:hypothetical protein